MYRGSRRFAQALDMANRPSAIQTLTLVVVGALSAYAYVRLLVLWGVADRSFVRLAGSTEGGFFLTSFFSLCLFSFLVATVLVFLLSRLCGRYFNIAAAVLVVAFVVSWLVLAVIGGTSDSISLVSFVTLFAVSAFFVRRHA